MPTNDLDNRPPATAQDSFFASRPGAPTPPYQAPPTEPSLDAQPEPEDTSDYIFPSLDTDHLRRLRAQLRTNIPGDGTHAAAVSTLLGALVDFELRARPPVIDPAVLARRQAEPDTHDELETLAT
jgi:hypothetical protein